MLHVCYSSNSENNNSSFVDIVHKPLTDSRWWDSHTLGSGFHYKITACILHVVMLRVTLSCQKMQTLFIFFTVFFTYFPISHSQFVYLLTFVMINCDEEIFFIMCV